MAARKPLTSEEMARIRAECDDPGCLRSFRDSKSECIDYHCCYCGKPCGPMGCACREGK